MQSFKTYIATGFAKVKGMSSLTAAMVCGELLAYQNTINITGPVAEIGAYEGRFFIVLALAAGGSDKALAIDTFAWPDEGIHGRFMANCAREGVRVDNVRTLKSSSGDLTPGDIIRAAGGRARFVHVDGGHTYDPVLHDFRLAKYSLQADGIICADDVLHPLYPELTIAVTDWLKSSPEFQLFAVVDRESFSASAKFLICRVDKAEDYKAALVSAFPESVMSRRATLFGNEAVIIRPMDAPPRT